ncbi:MAG: cytochrome b [Alphaproteobacteria bacterium]|nr:cytochrome b [Alphaproteobacteria bacterium]
MSLNPKTKYSGLAMTLHWLVAIAVIVTWRIAEAAEHAPTREARGEIMGNHFALGVVIFLLVATRFIWRQMNPPPAQIASHAPWEKTLAKATHLAMYTLLLAMPLVGWFAMSTYGSPISVWGVVEVPALPVPVNPDLAGEIFDLHAIAGTTLLVLIAVHVLATLKHTFIDKDGTLFRMLPFGSVKR